jgi:hypothetical protein
MPEKQRVCMSRSRMSTAFLIKVFLLLCSLLMLLSAGFVLDSDELIVI